MNKKSAFIVPAHLLRKMVPEMENSDTFVLLVDGTSMAVKNWHLMIFGKNM
jgi:hypothetical protein